MQIVGAPIQKAVSPVPTDASIEIEFQFLNTGSNPAAELRIRVFKCSIQNPDSMVIFKDETMANPLFGGQGFHWILKASLPKLLDPRRNEEFIHVRLDYRDSDADGDLLLSEYFLKINIAEAAAANARKAEVQPFKAKIAAMV